MAEEEVMHQFRKLQINVKQIYDDIVHYKEQSDNQTVRDSSPQGGYKATPAEAFLGKIWN